ncbi:RDD family protein [Streptomyces actuosus]|uniref:RDD family protein n=1 Tax=Streptomyces actuosus TaxID=1885 RepID=A0ABS2VRY7_STRAS|nr:RDD family protein [Streptomyces actuosus]MBN0045854.1 RDD family protein [Streptomyces actuosus]
MSAPTPAPGDDRPREGYYPDPSIPGYVRYWNGSAWVPGTSRPAPTDGEPLAPPPGARPPQPAAPSVEETGPHFFDEDPRSQPAAEGQRGTPAEPASAWGADRSRQSGFGEEHRVSWGTPAQGADPRVPAPSPGPAPAADGAAPAPGTVVFRHPAAAQGERDEGTMLFGPAASPGRGEPGGTGTAGAGGTDPRAAGPAGAGFGTQGPVRAASAGTPQAGSGTPAAASGPGFAAGKAAADRAAAAQSQGRAPGQGAAPGPASGASAPAASGPPYGTGAPAGGPGAAASRAATAAPGVPHQAAAPAADPAASASAAPITSGPGGGQASWAQQVHRLAEAGEQEQPVAPWKPPVDDPFLAAARRQAAARPAGLGRRLAARLVDTLVLAAVTSAAAVPLGLRTVDHVNEKIDAAELSGHTVTVWIVDGTTSVYLGIVLAVLLVAGVLVEALPTARWGRTLGKKLLGLQVQDIEGHEPPSFGVALRRWLVYSVPGLLGIGLVGVAWCLFDRPWHQCWHDKAAHTFVAG